MRRSSLFQLFFLSAEQLKLVVFWKNKIKPCSLFKVDQNENEFIKSGNSQNKAPWKIASSNIPSLSGMNLWPWARNLNPQFDSTKTVKPVRAQRTEVNMRLVGLTWETSILTLWFTLTMNMCSLMGSLRVCLQEGYASFPIGFHRKIWQTVEFVSGWSCAHNA